MHIESCQDKRCPALSCLSFCATLRSMQPRQGCCCAPVSTDLHNAGSGACVREQKRWCWAVNTTSRVHALVAQQPAGTETRRWLPKNGIFNVEGESAAARKTSKCLFCKLLSDRGTVRSRRMSCSRSAALGKVPICLSLTSMPHCYDFPLL